MKRSRPLTAGQTPFRACAATETSASTDNESGSGVTSADHISNTDDAMGTDAADPVAPAVTREGGEIRPATPAEPDRTGEPCLMPPDYPRRTRIPTTGTDRRNQQPG